MKIGKLFQPNIERLIKKKNIPALIRCLKKDRYPYIQMKAVIVLGNFRDSRATQPLLELITRISTSRDINRSLLYDAIVSLGKIGDTIGISLVLEVLEKGNEHYRSAAITALGSSNTSPSPKIVALLIHYMYDSTAHISIHAAETLRKLICKPDQINDQVRYYAMNNMQDELIKIGKEAVDPLIKILDTGYSYDDANAAFLKEHIIKVLSAIGDKRAIDPLKRLLLCQYSSADIILPVYPTAQQALIAFGVATVKPLLEDLENENSSKKRERIIYILHQVTGQNFKDDIESWKEWIKNN